MGSVGKSVQKVTSGLTLGMSDSVIGSGEDAVPKIDSPDPVAPATKSSDNVRQAKENQRRQMAGRTGRSQSNILETTEAREDEEKDILG